MNKDTIIKVLLAIIALMVFAWLWCCRRAKNQSGSDAR